MDCGVSAVCCCPGYQDCLILNHLVFTVNKTGCCTEAPWCQEPPPRWTHPPLHCHPLLSEFHFADIVFEGVDHQVVAAVGPKLRGTIREETRQPERLGLLRLSAACSDTDPLPGVLQVLSQNLLDLFLATLWDAGDRPLSGRSSGLNVSKEIHHTSLRKYLSYYHNNKS